MKRILKSAILSVAVIAIALANQSCNSVKPVDKAQLAGYWTLKSLKGENAGDAFKGVNPGLQFDFENNTISGSGGCNNYSGGFTLNEKNEFSAPNLVSTMKACFQENKKPQFLTALSTPNLSVSVSEAGELIFSQGDVVVLQFAKGKTPAQKSASADIVNAENLTGKWNLVTIAGGDMATLFTDKQPTMEIAADGKVFGQGGCNTYRTSYELKENTITFKPAAATMMACPSLKGEGMFTSLLTETPLQAGLNGDKLTFFKNGDIVLEFVKDTTAK